MTSTVTLTFNHNAKIVVPDSLNLITPYVLQEQQDWFEDEIKFLRVLLQPGQKIIDIGANYGVYTISMAQSIGATGNIWAFEPASITADMLAAGIQANGFDRVTIDRRALSHTSGTAELSLHDNSELNSLTHDHTGNGKTETVQISTLDECLQRYEWQQIDFMKIDAEGEEINILQGGKEFFAKLSPLVQYEIKVSNGVDLNIVKAFAAIGYDSYRLVPGLNILMPFDPNEEVDGYLLNLFCCKQDRASELVRQGYLIDAEILTARDEVIAKLTKRIQMRDRYSWRSTIAKLPYGAKLKDNWEQSNFDDDFDKLNEAMSFYALSRDTQLSNKERFLALQHSYLQIRALCESNSAHLRLSSLARVAADFGERVVAVQALDRLCQTISEKLSVDISEPFLVPNSDFDTIAPSDNMGTWCYAAILEQIEKIGSFSSFYTGRSAQQRLEFICNMGLNREEMSRRLSLIHKRFNLSSSQPHFSVRN
jgi:FkbM family methyltransferase